MKKREIDIVLPFGCVCCVRFVTSRSTPSLATLPVAWKLLSVAFRKPERVSGNLARASGASKVSAITRLWARRVEYQIHVGCGSFVLAQIGEHWHPASVKRCWRAHNDRRTGGDFSDETR